MLINDIKFIGGFTNIKQCPQEEKPEYAFIGRSNVGKSSLINMLSERKGIARVSHRPGKTQEMNYYLVNNNWYLVDLPGYGYAKVSKEQRKKWERFLRTYLQKRLSLQNVFLLVDARIKPQKADLEFANWMGELLIPFSIVYTKIDNKKYDPSNIEAFRAAMLENWEQMPVEFTTSAHKKVGKDELLAYISEINASYEGTERKTS